MKLITELVEDNKVIIEATEGGKKNLYLEGTWIQAELKNRNGRWYPYPVVEREVMRYSRDYIDKGRALGELGHPEGPQINLDRVSHRIVALQREGNNFKGRAVITDTPMGNIARGLIESGVQLGVSTRGMGSLKERNGVMEVQDDFFLATAGDIVADPSAPDAFVNGIYEGAEWVWDNGLLKTQQVEQAKKYVSRASRQELEEAKLRVFKKLLQNF